MSAPPLESPRPTLVLVPGMDGTGRLFAPLVRALEGVDVRIASYVDRTEAEERAIERVVPTDSGYVLVAESFGGPIAMRFAATRPPGLVGLVLVATFLSSPVSKPVGRALRFVPSAIFDRAPPAFAVRLAMTGLEADAALVNEVRATIDSVPAGRLAERVRRVATIDVRSAAVAIDVPVLVIAALRDRLVPLSRARDLHSAFSGRASGRPFVTLDGPHLLLQKEPEACAKVLREFLSSL